MADPDSDDRREEQRRTGETPDASLADPARGATEALGHALIGHAIAVHQALGPGFAEAVYRRALEVEFRRQGIAFDSELSITVSYRGVPVGCHRLDFLVERRVVVELKVAPAIEPVHRAQVVAYLRSSGCRLGYVLNFGAPTLGIRRVVL